MNPLQIIGANPGLTVLVVWAKLSLVAGLVARYKNRSFLRYFTMSVVLTPVVGLIASMTANDMRPQRQRRLSSSELESTIRQLMAALEQVEAEEERHPHGGDTILKARCVQWRHDLASSAVIARKQAVQQISGSYFHHKAGRVIYGSHVYGEVSSLAYAIARTWEVTA